MQWGERTETRRIKPGLTEPGAAKPTQWILSWADGAFSLLGQDEGAPGRDPSGIQGGFSPVWASVGCRVCPQPEHPSLPRRDV